MTIEHSWFVELSAVAGNFHSCFVSRNVLLEGKAAYCPHSDQNSKEDVALPEASMVAAAATHMKSSQDR